MGEKNTGEKSPVRKQIGVQMDIDLWWQFKERAMRERKSAGVLLEELVQDYLKKQKRLD